MNLTKYFKAENVFKGIVTFLVVLFVVLNIRAGEKPTLLEELKERYRGSRTVSAAELTAHPAMQLLSECGVPLSLVIDHAENGDRHTLGAPLHAVTSGERFLVEVDTVPYARTNKLLDHAGDASHTPTPEADGLVEHVGYGRIRRPNDKNIGATHVRLAELPASFLHREVDLGAVTIEGNVHVPAPGVNTYYEREFTKSRDRIRVYIVSKDEMEALEDLRRF